MKHINTRKYSCIYIHTHSERLSILYLYIWYYTTLKEKVIIIKILRVLQKYYTFCLSHLILVQTCLCTQSIGHVQLRLFCPWDFSGKTTRVGCYLLSREPSQPKDWTHGSFIGRWILYHWATKEAQEFNSPYIKCHPKFNNLSWEVQEDLCVLGLPTLTDREMDSKKKFWVHTPKIPVYELYIRTTLYLLNWILVKLNFYFLKKK